MIASSIMTKNVDNANSSFAQTSEDFFKGNMNLDDWRTSIVALSWTEVGLFAFLVVSGLARCCSR